MLPQHLAGIVLENVIIHNILYKFFMFIFISSFQVFILIFLYVLSFYITLYSILSQQMLLLFILLVLDGKTNYYLFIYIISIFIERQMLLSLYYLLN